MADQGLWFKLWCSADDDPDLDNLDIADFGRWCKLGTFVKRHGTAGSLEIRPPARALCARLQVPHYDALMVTLTRFPHVTVRRANSDVPGETTAVVSFDNWSRYQGDYSTPRTQRWRRSQERARGEEKRREETRREVPPSDASHLSPPIPPGAMPERTPGETGVGGPTAWPEDLREVREWLVTHHAPPVLQDPAYWRRIDDWLGSPDSGVGYLDELAKYLAWDASLPTGQRHRDAKRGFRNWLAKSEFWSQQRAQTQVLRDRDRRRSR